MCPVTPSPECLRGASGLILELPEGNSAHTEDAEADGPPSHVASGHP